MARTIVDHAGLLVAATRPAQRDLERLVATAEALPHLGLTISGLSAWEQVAQAAEAQGRDDIARRAHFVLATATLADLATSTGIRPKLLTARELEVARAVADGRTSREVAEQLGRSVRTVDNHLAAVFRKLGVSRRQDLAPLMAEIELDRPRQPRPRPAHRSPE